MGKNLKDAIVAAVATSIITIVFNMLVAGFALEKGSIRLGNLVEVEKGKYMISADIKNFTDNNFDKIRIKIPQDIELSSIKTSQPLKLIKISNNTGNQSASIYEIDRITEKQQVTINIVLNSLIDVKDIMVEKNNNKIEIEYPGDMKNPLEEQRNQIITNSLIYALILGVGYYMMSYLFDKRAKILIDEVDANKKYYERDKKGRDEAIEKINERYEQAEEKIRDTRKEMLRTKEEGKKRELLYMARIKDYKKELDFWRNTIRMILYKSKSKKVDSEDIFNEVTNSLATYQTKSKECEDFDMIKVMAKIIKGE